MNGAILATQHLELHANEDTQEQKLGPQNSSSITYDSPPLVEVAMSVQFDPPRELNQAHLGAFWATQRDQLPIVRTTQPIATTNEVFGNQGQWLPPSLQFALTNEPECRLQMTSVDDQWMCQVQRNRVVVNWRKRNAEYPRFGATWLRFSAIWRDWQQFLEVSKLPAPKSRLWELTYVNRIPQNGLWEKQADWPNVLPGLWGGGFASFRDATLRGFHGQWVWETIDPPARLYVEPKPGPENVLILSLTARGPIAAPQPDAPLDAAASLLQFECGMTCGHDLIVAAFDSISSSEAKKVWKRHADTD